MKKETTKVNTSAAVKHQEESSEPVASRRSIFGTLWKLFGILAGIELAWIGSSILASRQRPHGESAGNSYIDAGKAETFKPGTVTAIGQGGFYVARLDDGGFLALASTCTHLGCALPWDEKEQKFICPCHGSTFDCRGEVLTSPATRALDIFPLRIENQMVKVDTGNRIKRLSHSDSQVVRL